MSETPLEALRLPTLPKVLCLLPNLSANSRKADHLGAEPGSSGRDESTSGMNYLPYIPYIPTWHLCTLCDKEKRGWPPRPCSIRESVRDSQTPEMRDARRSGTGNIQTNNVSAHAPQASRHAVVLAGGVPVGLGWNLFLLRPHQEKAALRRVGGLGGLAGRLWGRTEKELMLRDVRRVACDPGTWQPGHLQTGGLGGDPF